MTYRDNFVDQPLFSDDKEAIKKIGRTQQFLDWFYALDSTSKDFVMTGIACNCEEELLKEAMNEWTRNKL